MPATGWTKHDAAVYVARQTDLSPAERRKILDMLGLVEGLRVAPDPEAVRAAYVAGSLPGGGVNSLNNRPSSARGMAADRPPALRGELCPPGLRALIQGGEPVREPWQIAQEQAPEPVKPVKPKAAPRAPKAVKPKPVPKPTPPKPPKPPKPAPRPKVPAACGEESGYRKHKRDGTEVCPPCRKARKIADHRRGQARKDREHAAGTRQPRKIAACGTPTGYKRHRRLGEEACQPCRLAHRAENNRNSRLYRARKANERAQQTQAAVAA